MINLRFWIRALPLNPKVWRKANDIYRADELCFYLPSFKRKLSRSWLLAELFLVSFFCSMKENCYFNLVDPTRRFRVFFCCRSIVFVEGLVFEGESYQLAVLNFNNSPITHLVALKCGSTRELVISVILNSVGNHNPRACPALTGGLGGTDGTLQAHRAHGDVTIYTYIYIYIVPLMDFK